jgi:hypothetical protein
VEDGNVLRKKKKIVLDEGMRVEARNAMKGEGGSG